MSEKNSPRCCVCGKLIEKKARAAGGSTYCEACLPPKTGQS